MPVAKAKRTRDAAASREAILEAAEKTFAQHGFHGARVEAIAQAAGVAKGTVFLHFQDKENLLFALAEHRARSFQSLYAGLSEPGLSARERLEGLLDVRKWMSEDVLDFRRMMIGMWMTLPAALRERLQEMVRQTHRQLRERVAEVYREFLGARGLDGSDAEDLAAALLACVDGLTIRLRLPSPVPPMEAVIRAARLVFVENLGRRAEPVREKGKRKPRS